MSTEKFNELDQKIRKLLSINRELKIAYLTKREIDKKLLERALTLSNEIHDELLKMKYKQDKLVK